MWYNSFSKFTEVVIHGIPIDKPLSGLEERRIAITTISRCNYFRDYDITCHENNLLNHGSEIIE